MTISERKLAESNIEMTVADLQSKVPGVKIIKKKN